MPPTITPRARVVSPEIDQEFDINTPVPITFNLSRSDGSAFAGQELPFTFGSVGVIDDDFNAAPAASNARTFTTDSAGNIRFQVMSTVPRSFAINASGPNYGTGFSVRYIARTNSCDLQASSLTLSLNQSTTLTATILDSSNPVSRATVDFTSDSDGSQGTLTPRPDSRTHANGQITADYVAGSNTGTVELRALATNHGLSDNVTIIVQ